MKSEEAKRASIEVVDAVKCVLEAQIGKRPKHECVQALKLPVNRFCRIARDTEKRFSKKDPHYEISRFLGSDATSRRRMGIVCSSERRFPSCDKARSKSGPENTWEEYMALIPPCTREVRDALRIKPIEGSIDYSVLLSSFETMRDWMHMSGFATPDYVWAVPHTFRGKTKELFGYLASEKVMSPGDLEAKKREIEQW